MHAGVGAVSEKLHGMLIFALLLCLSACAGGHRPAPVYDRYNPPEKTPPYYIVSSGDTLFSIAWRYGFDAQRLANANGIVSPYTIFPGQAILLKEQSSPPPKPPSTTPVTAKGVSVKPPTAAVKPPRKAAVRHSKNSASGVEASWRWPVEGPVSRKFTSSGQPHKGIDIKGEMGEPVRASRGGIVVYAGSGLVGYGNLLILKHSERYLSAYGHNRRLLVREGQQVNAGDTLAELGDSGTDSAKLHFEVRVNGKPVDPLTLLPRR